MTFRWPEVKKGFLDLDLEKYFSDNAIIPKSKKASDFIVVKDILTKLEPQIDTTPLENCIRCDHSPIYTGCIDMDKFDLYFDKFTICPKCSDATYTKEYTVARLNIDDKHRKKLELFVGTDLEKKFGITEKDTDRRQQIYTLLEIQRAIVDYKNNVGKPDEQPCPDCGKKEVYSGQVEVYRPFEPNEYENWNLCLNCLSANYSAFTCKGSALQKGDKNG